MCVVSFIILFSAGLPFFPASLCKLSHRKIKHGKRQENHLDMCAPWWHRRTKTGFTWWDKENVIVISALEQSVRDLMEICKNKPVLITHKHFELRL